MVKNEWISFGKVETFLSLRPNCRSWGGWRYVLEEDLYTWDGCLRVSLEVPKGSQDTCSVWCGSRGGYGANAREIGLISIWFWVHRAILHSWGDIIVLIVLWQFCWGLSGVQSSKSRLLTCLIGKTQLLWSQCRGTGPHLACRGKSHGFSRVAAGTWGIFSSYSGDAHSKGSLFSEVRIPV